MRMRAPGLSSLTQPLPFISQSRTYFLLSFLVSLAVGSFTLVM